MQRTWVSMLFTLRTEYLHITVHSVVSFLCAEIHQKHIFGLYCICAQMHCMKIIFSMHFKHKRCYIVLQSMLLFSEYFEHNRGLKFTINSLTLYGQFKHQLCSTCTPYAHASKCSQYSVNTSLIISYLVHCTVHFQDNLFTVTK